MKNGEKMPKNPGGNFIYLMAQKSDFEEQGGFTEIQSFFYF